MATLQTIRNRAGLLIGIVIFMALVAFILGDMLRSGSSMFRKSQMEIAEIDGESIQYPDFQKKVEEIGNMYKLNSGQSQIDENTWVQIREQAWQGIVRDVLMSDVYKELGLEVSADELYDMVQGRNIHPIVRQIFSNPNTGQIDRAAIVRFLKNLETGVSPEQRSYWLYLEKQITDDRMLTKYNNLVRQGLYITTEEAQNTLDDNNHQVSFDYIALNYSAVPDSSVEVTGRDLKKYYNAHLNEYKQERTRRIEYITFPVTPSKQDDQHAKEWIDEIKADFTAAEDNAQFVNSNSDVSFDPTWKKESDLPEDIAKWVFTEGAKENDVYGPYFRDGAYRLEKVVKIAMMPDSVKARHILLRVEKGTGIEAKEALADSLKTAIENGSDFATLATRFSDDTGSALKGGDLGWFSRNQMVKPFEEAAFNAKVKEVTIVKSQYGIHIIQTTKRGVETRQVQIASLVRKVVPSDATYQKVYTEASKFASENTNLEEFDAAIAEKHLTKKVAILHENDRTIAGLDKPRSLIRAAFEAKEGELIADSRESTIFELSDNFVIAALVEASEEGVAPFEDVKTRVELAVIKEKKGEFLKEKATAVLNGSNDFAVIAQELNSEIKTAENLNFNSFSIPGTGVEPALIGTVSGLGADEVSKAIIGNNGVYIAKVTAINEGVNTDLVAEQNRLMQSMGYRAKYEAYKALQNSVEIVDKRFKFY
ncbi:Periplasmic chaperone and peptidyl-prolyl cis-trans isomerase of outer membrane proteins SurA [hydrothermal vent metagenome]|uniref:Periplasmic chaperone PpiD n=1 Tax=hydrothermal vent metagenome TaxID=652676 RepID=A0A3B0TIQ6_9ZZZZ